jgi:hypothetical protein
MTSDACGMFFMVLDAPRSVRMCHVSREKTRLANFIRVPAKYSKSSLGMTETTTRRFRRALIVGG